MNAVHVIGWYSKLYFDSTNLSFTLRTTVQNYYVDVSVLIEYPCKNMVFKLEIDY